MLVLAHRRSGDPAGRGRSRGRDVGGGAARHRPGVRRRPAGAAAAGRAGRQRGPDRRPRWPGSPIVASHAGPKDTTGAGRLLAALLARGARRGPGHRRPRRPDRRTGNWPAPSTIRSSCPTAGWSRTATSTARRSPPCSTSWPSRSPTSPASAERRTDRMLDAARSHGLPPFLAHEVGVDSGHMIAQYTQAGIVVGAQAAGRSGVGRLHPVVGDAGGPRLDGLARRRASCAAPSTGCARVLAIEMLTAARALDLRAPLTPGPVTGAVLRRHPDQGRRARPGPPSRARDRRRRRPARRRCDHRSRRARDAGARTADHAAGEA